MDPFSESDFFDDDMAVSPSPNAEDADPVTLAPSSGSALAALFARNWPVIAVAALAMLVVGGLVAGMDHSTGVRVGVRHGDPAHRRFSRVAHRRRHAAPPVVAPTPSETPHTVVILPNQTPKRPTETPSVGGDRPISPPTVGNTGQFAYLGS